MPDIVTVEMLTEIREKVKALDGSWMQHLCTMLNNTHPDERFNKHRVYAMFNGLISDAIDKAIIYDTSKELLKKLEESYAKRQKFKP